MAILAGVRPKELYGLIPDFRDRCPLCDGSGCAVHHGVYFRVAVDRDGTVYPSFPVPRFRCCRRGPGTPEAVTFSVLPVVLVPRVGFSLPLLVWLMELFLLSRRSIRELLDALAGLPAAEPEGRLLVDPVVPYRVSRLFARAYLNLQSHPLPEVELPPGLTDVRRQASAVVAVCIRGSPADLVESFHKRWFPRLLFGVRP